MIKATLAGIATAGELRASQSSVARPAALNLIDWRFLVFFSAHYHYPSQYLIVMVMVMVALSISADSSS